MLADDYPKSVNGLNQPSSYLKTVTSEYVVRQIPAALKLVLRVQKYSRPVSSGPENTAVRTGQ